MNWLIKSRQVLTANTMNCPISTTPVVTLLEMRVPQNKNKEKRVNERVLEDHDHNRAAVLIVICKVMLTAAKRLYMQSPYFTEMFSDFHRYNYTAAVACQQIFAPSVKQHLFSILLTSTNRQHLINNMQISVAPCSSP